jgi:DNA-binding CsgD family transcriptional regulator
MRSSPKASGWQRAEIPIDSAREETTNKPTDPAAESLMDASRSEVFRIFARILDGLEEAVALLDSAGRMLHMNPAMSGVLVEGAAIGTLREQIEEVAGATIRRHHEAEDEVSSSKDIPQEVVSVLGSRIRIRGHYLGPLPPNDSELVLVLLQHPSSDPVSPESLLRERFRLTQQQMRVARLLAQRLSNEEIARELGISSHTARHHSEKVMNRLGVRSRRKVAALLRGLDADRSGDTADP